MAFSGFTLKLTPVSSGAHISSYHRLPSTTQGKPRPILVLLHGYPQNNLMWKDFVNEIPAEFPVFVPDLPSYGLSIKDPSASGDSLAHSKREWGKDIMEALDIVFDSASSPVLSKVIPFGHDRGARLAYRLALDVPERVVGAGVLDIVPTSFVWGAMKLENNHRETKSSWHWVFLSSPRPFPETLISSNADFFFTNVFQRWTGADAKTQPSWTDWVSDSIKPYTDPTSGGIRVIGSCEDYRAGATHDLNHDLESGIDPSNPVSVFQVPLLVLSSVHLRRRFPVDEIWTSLASEGLVKCYQIGGNHTGHFLVNEQQQEVGQKTREWLNENWNV
ncbi:alpha/beta-hydrolase [Ramaria rubella]|nr:alpha/beta-hydrolase [Ramaria rubella]